MSNQAAEHIEGLLRPFDDQTASNFWRDRKARTPATDDDSRPARSALEPRSPSATEPLKAVAPEDIAPVRETLEQQNELLRAILASSVDTQTDARATAQNSRTFAWAGAAIALLTLIATVISIVAAVGAH